MRNEERVQAAIDESRMRDSIVTIEGGQDVVDELLARCDDSAEMSYDRGPDAAPGTLVEAWGRDWRVHVQVQEDADESADDVPEYERVEARLLAGEAAADVAEGMDLDYNETWDAVVLPSWWASTEGDDDYEIGPGRTDVQAAEEFVAGGDWGTEPGPVRVRVWRVGLYLAEGDKVHECQVDRAWHEIAAEAEAEDADEDEGVA